MAAAKRCETCGRWHYAIHACPGAKTWTEEQAATRRRSGIDGPGVDPANRPEVRQQVEDEKGERSDLRDIERDGAGYR